ncbi:MAG: signal recognition particle protein [Bifidobacteriaceae bacterium]|jgi:signal recognition particle subunit SRP54|nr:signal recognition particle protein [Bifidobacteriaceae bacterium]
MFDNFSDKLNSAFDSLKGKGTLRISDVDKALESIKEALIEGDVALEVVNSFIGDIKSKAYEITKSKSLNPAQQVVRLVNEELIKILGGQVSRPISFAKKGPTVILLAGLQGSGKTTFAGKLAKWLKNDGHTPVLVAADLQRPNAVGQLQTVGEAAGVSVYAPAKGVTSEDEANSKKSLLSRIGIGSKDNPIEVAQNGVKMAAEKHYDTVIIDTAGRLAVDVELMKQVSDISQAIQPNEILFVIDSMLGQDAALSAKAFSSSLDLTGIVLTKIDGDARGGAALSVVSVTGKPIIFASTGEKLDDIELFHPDRIASRILNMGDILSLIEKAEKTISEEKAEELAAKITSGKGFDFNDFLVQMNQIKKMGSIRQIASMIPGLAQNKQALSQVDDSQITIFTSIVQSMTPFERANPKEISGTRRTRIAKGSGRSSREVNLLLERFKAMSKMMQKFGGQLGGKASKQSDKQLEDVSADDSQFDNFANKSLPNMPLSPQEMTGLPNFGMPRSSSKKTKKGKKKKFGNPAKQAAWEAKFK